MRENDQFPHAHMQDDLMLSCGEMFTYEAQLLSQLNHPNIVRMFAVVVQDADLGGADPKPLGDDDEEEDVDQVVCGIVLEYVKNGSLLTYLR